MVISTQTICQQHPTNCLRVFDHFVGLALKGLTAPLEFQIKPLQDNVPFLYTLKASDNQKFSEIFMV